MNTLRPCSFQLRRWFLCILLLALGLLVHMHSLFAQESGVSLIKSARLSGAAGQLTVNAALNLGYTPQNEQSVVIKNIITLSIDEESTSYIPEDFTASVTLQIDYGTGQTPTDQTTQSLQISYSKTTGLTYNPKNYFSFNNAQVVNITVLSPITAPVLSNGVDTKTLLVLQNEMRVIRYYQLNSVNLQPVTFTEQPHAANPTPDELPVSWEWAPNAGNNGTQLEWTWLEGELAGNYTNGNGSIDYDRLFRRNATRIDLPLGTGKYNIPLFYDGHGQDTLYYRIRATNYVQSGNRQDGPWSDVHKYAFSGHNNNLNWQAATTYAEEGNRKSVMKYFDGSLRMRQTVTKDNSTNTTISSETFYDGQGRPAIQILPAPGINNIVAYNENLNRFNGQSAGDDPALAFDLHPANGGSATPALTGATALYYSGANSEKGVGANGNIPDAESYPYTVTRYTPDGTGRIMSQSGVGSAMKMGNGHETKYYYGSAAPEELDGLFGTDAGNPTHYYKNMVKDANGQMNVSYVDMRGRTIATALAGDSTSGMLNILNAADYPKQTGTTLTRNLLDLNTNVAKGNSIESLNTILVPATTAYQFTYKLDPQELQLATCSTGVSVCYDCMYDLEITITDESGDLAPVVRKFTNVSLSANNGCNAISSFSQVNGGALDSPLTNNKIVFSETLLPGSYAVRKTLTISEASLQQQKEAWLQVGLCKSQQELIDSVYTVLEASSGCKITDSLTACQSCIAELGTYTTYRAKYIQNLDPARLPSEAQIQAAYSVDSATCAGLCTNRSHKLNILRSLMLSDMMPYTGQYAKDPLAAVQSSMWKQYDIFAVDNHNQFYREPWDGVANQKDFYYDVNHNKDESIHPATGDPYSIVNGLTPAEFTERFTPTWAESLLPHHPEYERLVFSQQNLAASYDWIDNFNQVAVYNNAVNNYVSSTGHPEDYDPFFTTAPSSYKSAMTNFVSGAYFQGLSLWQMAYGDVACKTILDSASRAQCYIQSPKQPPFTGSYALNAAQMNQAWSVFQGFYSMVRDSMVNDYIKVNKPLSTENDLVSQGYILRFPTSVSQQVTQYNWTGFPTTWGAAPTISMTDYVAANRTSRCSSYIDQWKRELSQCPALTGRSDSAAILTEITTGMEQVCEHGLDEANPYGASSVSPSYAGTPRNFEDVIHSVFQAHSIPRGQYCNPFVIESPKPYSKGPKYTKEVITVLDTCNCKQFAKVKTAAAEAGHNVNDRQSLNQYLDSAYHDTLTVELFNGLQHCSEIGDTVCHLVHIIEAHPCGGIGFTSNESAKTAVAAPAAAPPPSDTCYTDYFIEKCDTILYYPLTTAQPKPAFLNCGFEDSSRCISCARLSALITEYKAYFSGQPCAAAPVLNDDSLTSEEISYNQTFALFVNYRTGLQYNWFQYVKAADGAECNLANYAQNSEATQNVICAETRPLNDSTGLFVKDPPCQHAYDMAIDIGASIYQQRKEQLLADFEAQYRAKCMSAKAIEQFSVKYDVKEYHYTLYYYDMAGNLVQTVPPKGARPDFSQTFIAQVESAKAGGTDWTPPHELITSYRYNSLNAVVVQKAPDAGITQFWYDKLGRLAVSQNAQQAVTPASGNVGSKYSYTLYDDLGRVKEVGQKPQTAGMDQTTSQNETNLGNWINQSGEAKEQITRTEYDLPVGFNTNGLMTQQNLRTRVSYTYTQNKETDPNWYTATIYSYDVAGNVSALLHDYKGVSGIDAASQYKLINYKYDLVSGKTNEVDYQPGNPDAFYHRYLYDAENRLTEVYTSRDKIVWERDAAYSYYKHGPLQRTVLGQQQTQGLDYTYTLQGWLKGVNVGKSGGDASGENCPSGTALDDAIIYTRPATNAPSTYTARNSITFDMEFANDNNTDEYETMLDNNLGVCTAPGGTGGAITETYPIAQDAYTYSLHYYPGDYKPIDNTVITMPILETLAAQAAPLYNGNIAAMAVDLPTLGNAKVYNYHYDQLNRLKQMDAFGGLDLNAKSFTADPLNDYRERLSYDPNGNITSYLRRGTTAGSRPLLMDSLFYNYYPNTNQLSSVNDGIPATNYTNDIDDQVTNNYTYDAIGNLTKDDASDISDIKWTVYGKIASITKSTSTITYTYDAAGNRITKTLTPTTDGYPHTTIYVRDAQGNVLSTYEKIGTNSLQQTEINLFGSNRLGMIKIPYKASLQVTVGEDMGVYGIGITDTLARGLKLYELANHLGNVLAAISDKKIAVPSTGNSSLIDHYTANVINAQDNYPFGMIMPGRSYAAAGSGAYRYGFNGKENDNEVKGEGNQQDYGMRIYDPRVGRFLSVDPLSSKYPWITPYAFAENDVIRSIDLDGTEKKIVVHWVSGFYNDKTPIIKKTSVDIDKNVRFIEIYTKSRKPTGKVFAHTEIYYALPDGSFHQAETLREEINPDLPKPSANYDYTIPVLPEKGKEDDDYIWHQYTKWGDYAAPLDILNRDLNAPDNAITVESLSGVNASFTVIGVPFQVRGMQAVWVGESTKGWSAFSKAYQEQIAGQSGRAVMVNGVKFDGFVRNALVDAKGKYAFLLQKGWAQEGLLKQAQRQIKAAKGARIEWHFAEEEAAKTVKQLFKDKGVKGIEVFHSPSITP